MMGFSGQGDAIRTWHVFLLIALCTGLLSLIYLWPSCAEFPMDDSYIHMVYAQNLAVHRGLFFNTPDEKGMGTTSIMWVLLLGAGQAAGISMRLLAKILGVISLIIVGLGVYLLLRARLGSLLALFSALLVSLSGNMLWFALSGMETTLFLALGVAALLLYRHERWAWLGAVMGLMTLTRPEGLALVLAVESVELLRRKRICRGPAISGLICLLLAGPWFGYLWLRSGSLMPTSGLGKHFSTIIGEAYLLQRGGLAWIRRVPGLFYVATWAAFLIEFALGGMSLPEPRFPVFSIAGDVTYSVSAWAIPGWVLVLTLLFAAGRHLGFVRRWMCWLPDPSRRPFLVLLMWVALHNLAYLAFLPVPGTASRYGAINHVILWVALVVGLLAFVNRPRLMVGLGAGVAALALANTIYWNGVYDANLDHMTGVRIAAAHCLRDEIPAGRLCAASDIGALRWESGRTILDLGGLTDPNARQWYEKGEVDSYLLENGISCLVLPGRAGSTQEGWYDISGILGLTTSPLMEMRLVRAFQIDRERWLEGYLPTGNYQESVAIYEIIPEPGEVRR